MAFRRTARSQAALDKRRQWGQGGEAALGKSHFDERPTAFEAKCRELNLATDEQQMRESAELRAWVEKHAMRYYVPEWLLAAWSIVVNYSELGRLRAEDAE